MAIHLQLKIIKITLGFLLLLFLLVEILNNTLTKNISISEPIGYYLKLPIVGTIKRGDKYLICITDIKYIKVLKQLGLPSMSNRCPYSSPYLIKQVAGVPGDAIEIVESGVLINHQLQPNSFSFNSSHGVNLYPLPVGYKTILGSNDYFVLGVTPHSVDSRYFGIVKRDQFYKQTFLIFRENIK